MNTNKGMNVAFLLSNQRRHCSACVHTASCPTAESISDPGLRRHAPTVADAAGQDPLVGERGIAG